ncbi:hypothetical protein IAF28_20995, partial [Acinetobacter baumannii]|uniref:hypothetical protein n=1 Tax=Acinetobacter baumannii TaxID=470 RepID=UPI00165F2CC8
FTFFKEGCKRFGHDIPDKVSGLGSDKAGLVKYQHSLYRLIKLDAKRNNVVVSRRAVMEAESSADREALLAQLEEGQTVTGT